MLMMIITIVAFLLFVTTIVFSVRNWKWFQITMVCFVYIAANLLVVMSVRSLKPRVEWMAKTLESEQKLSKARREGAKLSYGDLTEVGQTEPNLRMLKAKVGRVLTGRGRVWRGLKNAGAQQGQLTLQGPGQESLGFAPQSIVYLFGEEDHPTLTIQDGATKFKVPTVYLGEYAVSAANATGQVTIAPTLSLDANMLAAMQAATSFAIYEIMPIDGHRLFSLKDALLEPIDDARKPLFGEMDKQTITEIFVYAVRRTFPNLPQDQVAPLVTRLTANYLRDGSPSADAPDVEWMKIKFTKVPADAVSVDSEGQPQNFDDRYFETDGRAVPLTLRRGKDIKFAVDDVVVFHKEKAQEYIDQGVATQSHSIYVRPLNDYENRFHQIRNRVYRIAEEVKRVRASRVELDATIAKLKTQIKFREGERDNLKSDLALHKKDLAEITGLRGKLTNQKAALLKDLAAIHEHNRFMASEIARLDKKLRDRINAAAAASAEKAEKAAVGTD